MLADLLKGLFVEIADREFRLGDAAPTDSRITLISGVHRKDVRRLRGADAAGDEVVPDSISLGGRLATDWLTDERFLDARGRPRPLPKVAVEVGQLGFDDLVASRSTDIRSRVVLDEWLRLGIVHIDARERVVLDTDAFVPQAGYDEKLFFFAHNLHDHAAAATANLLGATAPHLERALIYEGLTAEAVTAVDQRARSVGMQMLQDLNRLATERDEAETSVAGARYRLTCGIYFYSEPMASPADCAAPTGQP